MPLDRPFNAFPGLAHPFGRRRGDAITDLFRNGEEGTALIVGPNVCFQDAAGTTPAGASNPVGLVLDTSQGAGYSGGSFTGLGVENIEPALGPYAAIPSEITGPNGTISIENGNVRVTSPGNTSCRMEIAFPVESGKSYSVNATINSNFGVVPTAFVDVTIGPFNQSFFGVASVSGLVQATSTGTARIRLYPRSGSGPTQQAGDYVEASAFSVRELPGVHAYQSDNDDYRPTLARHPVGGRRNLLTYTEDFENAAWNKTRCLVVDQGDGSFKTISTEATFDGSIGQTKEIGAGETWTLSVEAKAAERDFLFIREGLAEEGVNDTYFNLGTGTLGTVNPEHTATITEVEDGFYLCKITFTNDGTERSGKVEFFNSADNSSTSSSEAGDGIFLRKPQFELGPTPTAYQKVVSQYDVTEAGKADLWYLDFDGVDDYLVTPSITPGTDKVQVFAGVRKESDAAATMVAEFSQNFSSLDGSFALRAPVTATSNLGFTSGGTTRNTATASDVSLAAPVTKVMTGLGDIPGDTSTLRLDGVQAAQNTSDQGSGNYLAYPLYIGARAGAGYFFDGNLYGLVVRFGPNLSEAEINRTERYLAQKTGITL